MNMRRAPCSACATLLVLITTSLVAQSAAAVNIAECSTDSPRGNLSLGSSWQDRLPASQQMQGLAAGSCDVWVIPPSTLKGTPCGSGAADGYVLVEFWKLWQNDSGWAPSPRSASPKAGISIVAAKGGVPGLVMPLDDSAMQQASPLVASSPASPRSGAAGGQPAAAAASGGSGHSSSFYWDATAASYLHPYHRLFLPLNALSMAEQDGDTSAGNSRSSSGDTWYLQVTNRNAGGLQLPGYSLRATCLPNRSLIPCPTADPDAGECSDRGGCLAAPSMTPVPPQQRSFCACPGGWGGPSCEEELPQLELNPATPLQLVLEPGAWQYYVLELPQARGQGMEDVEVLAELTRAPGRQGGDPLLFLKPFDAADRMLPFLDSQQQDLNSYADMDSFMLQQTYHYVLRRIQRPAGAVPRRWYVAVFNHNSTQELREARVTLRVLYRDLSREALVCPRGCSGNGACTNPLPLAGNGPGNSGMGALPRQVGLGESVTNSNAATAGFDCVCAPGWGGVLCEGQQRNVTVGGGNLLQGPWPLGPGTWNFYLLTIDPGFNSKYSNLGVQWFIGMAADVVGGNFSNGYLMFSKSTFPREPAAQDDQWRKGLISYAALAARSNPPKPIEVQGRDLIPGQTYIMGVLNSEYMVEDPFIYSLRFFVPGDVPTLLHPYMSIVLGVTAAVLLCLVMTLAKRVIMRMGWLGWQRPQAGQLEELEGEAGLTGPRGVPEDIYTAFPTYTYNSKDAAAAGKEASPGDAATKDDAAPKDAGDITLEAHKQVSVPVAAVTVEVPAPAAAAIVSPVASVPASPTAAGVAANEAQKDGPADPELGTAAGSGGSGSGGPTTPTSAATSAASSGAAATALVEDEGSESDDICCPVCLCEYMDGEVLRELPCHHVFHQPCIDKWMVAHSTCPCCRTPLWEGAAEHLQQAMLTEQAAAAERAAMEQERMRQPWYRWHPRQLLSAIEWTRRVPNRERSLQLPRVAGRQQAQQDERQQRRRQMRQQRQQRRRAQQQQQGVPDIQRQSSRSSLQQLVSLSRQASASAGAAVARQWSGIAAAVGVRTTTTSNSNSAAGGAAAPATAASRPEAV